MESVQNTILDITRKQLSDESIEELSYYEYEPQNPSALNSNTAISIDINNQDMYMLPSRSYLLIEGLLTKKAAGEAYSDTADLALVNNAMMFLFSTIRYSLNNIEIERILNPGQTLTMLNLAKNHENEYLDECWAKDTDGTTNDTNKGYLARKGYLITAPKTPGRFSFRIPLNAIFGFCEDYTKILYGLKHTLVFERGTSNDNVIIKATAATDDGKISLTKMTWSMPHIKPALQYRNSLAKLVESKSKIPVGFRTIKSDEMTVPQSTNFNWRITVDNGTERPSYILIAFQTNRENDQTKTPAVFDNVDLQSIQLYINSEPHPQLKPTYDFNEMQIFPAYHNFKAFKHDCYGDETQTSVTPLEYRKMFPIHIFDVRYKSEQLKITTQDISIKCDFRKAVPANTKIYAVILHDRLITLDANGNNFNVNI